MAEDVSFMLLGSLEFLYYGLLASQVWLGVQTKCGCSHSCIHDKEGVPQIHRWLSDIPYAAYLLTLAIPSQELWLWPQSIARIVICILSLAVSARCCSNNGMKMLVPLLLLVAGAIIVPTLCFRDKAWVPWVGFGTQILLDLVLGREVYVMFKETKSSNLPIHWAVLVIQTCLQGALTLFCFKKPEKPYYATLVVAGLGLGCCIMLWLMAIYTCGVQQEPKKESEPEPDLGVLLLGPSQNDNENLAASGAIVTNTGGIDGQEMVERATMPSKESPVESHALYQKDEEDKKDLKPSVPQDGDLSEPAAVRTRFVRGGTMPLLPLMSSLGELDKGARREVIQALVESSPVTKGKEAIITRITTPGVLEAAHAHVQRSPDGKSVWSNTHIILALDCSGSYIRVRYA